MLAQRPRSVTWRTRWHASGDACLAPHELRAGRSRPCRRMNDLHAHQAKDEVVAGLLCVDAKACDLHAHLDAVSV